MGTRGRFEEEEKRGASNFAEAARDAGVQRIIYVGGLGSGEDLSPHLSSRHAVGRILAKSGVPTIEFRASIVIGSGSLSFELVRSLSERLPIMIVPRWTRMKAQPIAVEDLVEYLSEALDAAETVSGIYEIGGPDQVTYLGLMREYCVQRGLKRLFLPVPVLTPWLSSLWLGLVTPVYARIGRKLVESLVHETVVEDGRALKEFSVRPRGVREAMERALVNEDRRFATTRWSDAMSSAGPARRFGGQPFGSRLVDSRSIHVPVPTEVASRPVLRIGGETGWYFGDFLWDLRGGLDLLVGGVGMRRGRRDPDHVVPGDTIDFWRVESVEPGRLLRLSAEMKLPGRAWLQFEIEPDERGSVIRQTAIFDPVGLAGLLYWYGIFPLHVVVFRGMLRNIARVVVKEAVHEDGTASA
jgi:uncharacterized protein YbjT (DUF2867 family)